MRYPKTAAALSVTALMLLSGCWSNKTRSREDYDAVHPDVAGTSVPRGSVDTVRSGQNIRVYQTGRTVDPNNPNMMHEASTLYVLADSGAWNTSPNHAPMDPRHNRQVTLSGPLLAEKQLEIEQLKQTTEVMRKLGNELIETKRRLQEAMELNRRLEKSIIDNGEATQKKLDEYDKTSKAQARKLSDLQLQLEEKKIYKDRKGN